MMSLSSRDVRNERSVCRAITCVWSSCRVRQCGVGMSSDRKKEMKAWMVPGPSSCGSRVSVGRQEADEEDEVGEGSP